MLVNWRAASRPWRTIMRHLGYHTVLSGKMHFIGPDQQHGFDERTVTDVYPAGFDWVADWQAGPAFVPSATGLNGVVDAGPAARTLQEDFDEEVAHAAVQTIYDLARRGDNAGPWFQIASFTSPHTPFVADKKYWDRYDPATLICRWSGLCRLTISIMHPAHCSLPMGGTVTK